ncbi:spn-E [Symbiodinium sp. CCMP2456]|nr:spn-E [Symbiodinium sp. CCMP2456]
MAALPLAQILREEKVPEPIASQLSSQLTVHSFPCICEGVESLEECLHSVLDAPAKGLLNTVSLACIKAAYHRCISAVMAVATPSAVAAPAASNTLAATPSTWTETFPAKLSVDRVKSMLSEEKQDEVSASRPKKIARIDDFLFDDIPSREIADGGVSQMKLLFSSMAVYGTPQNLSMAIVVAPPVVRSIFVLYAAELLVRNYIGCCNYAKSLMPQARLYIWIFPNGSNAGIVSFFFIVSLQAYTTLFRSRLANPSEEHLFSDAELTDLRQMFGIGQSFICSSCAEADPVLLEQLVQIEVDNGWLRCIASLEDARSIWPNVAVCITYIADYTGGLATQTEARAFFVRALHLLIYIAHFLAMYVDDLLGFQSASVAEMSFCIALCFCGAFSIPLSWKKLQFGYCIRWIGWELDFGMGCVCIPSDKLERLHSVISSKLQGKYTDRATLSKLCGMLQWLFKLFPLAKPWLRSLYQDLHTPRATNFSVRQNEWQLFVSCLNDALYLTKLPAGAAITVGSRVLAVRHRKVSTKQQLLGCNIGDKDIWLRIADPASKRRALSAASRHLLRCWLHWSSLPPIWRALRPLQHLKVEAAADAMGNGRTFAIGGDIALPGGEFWFSECFTVEDFAFAELPLKSEAHKDISCYECLGQIALVWLLSLLHPGCQL